MESFTFVCPCCGETREGLPALAYGHPEYSAPMTGCFAKAFGALSSDFHVDRVRRRRSIRCVMSMPIIGRSERLAWGVWADISAKSFRLYRDAYFSRKQGELQAIPAYFASNILAYPNNFALPCRVRCQNDLQRPIIEFEGIDHPLIADLHDGITPERAVELAGPWLAVLHSSSQKENGE